MRKLSSAVLCPAPITWSFCDVVFESMNVKPSISVVDSDGLRSLVARESGLFICTAGYEDRALKAAAVIGRPEDSRIRVIRLVDGDASNDEAFEVAQSILGQLQAEEIIQYSLRKIGDAGVHLQNSISSLLLSGRCSQLTILRVFILLRKSTILLRRSIARMWMTRACSIASPCLSR